MQFEKVSNKDLNDRVDLIERTLQKGLETGMSEELEVRLLQDRRNILFELIKRAERNKND